MKQLVHQLKDLQKFDIALKGNIEDIVENTEDWASELVENAILEHLPRMIKARKLGKEFANEIINKDHI